MLNYDLGPRRCPPGGRVSPLTRKINPENPCKKHYEVPIPNPERRIPGLKKGGKLPEKKIK